MEQIDLQAPAPPVVMHYRVARLYLDFPGEVIRIELVGSDASERMFFYRGPEAVTLMLFLNTANLSTKSLHRRIMEKLLADGKLTGTISGAP